MSREGLPAPEAVDGKDWHVTRSSREGALSAPRQHVMAVPDGTKACPMCGKQHDRALRLRELARAKIGPKSAKAGLQWRRQCSEETLEAVERVRLNRWATSRVADVPEAFCPEELSAKFAALGDDLRAMTLATVQLTDADYRRWNLPDTPQGDWAWKLSKKVRDGIKWDSPFEDAAREAAWLDSMLDSMEDSLGDPGGENEEKNDDLNLETLLDFAGEYLEYEANGRNLGHMTLDKPALSVPVRPDRSARGRRSAEEGDTLRDATRMLTDGRIFAARRKKIGGSVLVDASGSMAWETDDLIRVVSGAPAALVGVYSGYSGMGTLRIVARSGRRVPDHLVRTDGGGNEIDVPALMWLAKQREPRVWLSDGQVCGSDVNIAWLCAVATKVCRKANIRRVATAQEIPAALAGRGGVLRAAEEED